MVNNFIDNESVNSNHFIRLNIHINFKYYMYIMIKNYVLKLMENLPENITTSKTPMKIDLIMSGGAFNGSYILGSLFFLKEMEKKNYLTIKMFRSSNLPLGTCLHFYLVNNLHHYI